MIATRSLHGTAAVNIQGKALDVHLVLVPSDRVSEFTALVRSFHETQP
jgi:hypothetical protein